MRRLFILVAAIVIAAASARADDAPPDPQMAPAPERLSYIKRYKYDAVAPNPTASPEEAELAQFKARMQPTLDYVEVQKTGDIRKEIQHFTNSTTLETWKSGAFTFFVHSANPKQIVVMNPELTPGAPVVTGAASDFAEVSWVKRADFQRAESKLGAPCYFYKSGAQSAWLDQSTRLPLAFVSPQLAVSYEYKTAPTETLKLPDKFVKKLELMKKAWRGAK